MIVSLFSWSEKQKCVTRQSIFAPLTLLVGVTASVHFNNVSRMQISRRFEIYFTGNSENSSSASRTSNRLAPAAKSEKQEPTIIEYSIRQKSAYNGITEMLALMFDKESTSMAKIVRCIIHVKCFSDGN